MQGFRELSFVHNTNAATSFVNLFSAFWVPWHAGLIAAGGLQPDRGDQESAHQMDSESSNAENTAPGKHNRCKVDSTLAKSAACFQNSNSLHRTHSGLYVPDHQRRHACTERVNE